MRKPQKYIQWRFAFFLTILLALNARFIGLDTESVTLPELTTLDAALRPLPELVSSFEFATSENSPLYNILLHIWGTIVPNSLFGLRSLSAFFSFAALFPLFGLARILFNKRISYTAIAIYALSPLAVTTSHSASPLSLFMLFSLMSTWGFFMMTRRHHKRFRIFYLATILGALFTHPAVWFLIIFHNIVAIGSFFHKENRYLTWKQWFTISTVLIVIIGLAFPEQLPTIALPFERGWSTPLLALAQLCFAQAGSIFLLLLSTGILYQLFFNAKRYHIVFNAFTSKMWFLILWLATTLFPPLLFSFYEGQFGRANGSVVSLFPFILLVSCGIDTFEHRKRRIRFIVVFLVLSVWSLYYRNTDPHIPNWKDATAFAVSNSTEAAVILGKPETEGLFDYYNNGSIHGDQLSFAPAEWNSDQWQLMVDSVAESYDSLHLFFAPKQKESSLLLNYLQNEFSIDVDTTTHHYGNFNIRIPSLHYLFLTRK